MNVAYPQTAALGTTQAVTATGPGFNARTQPAAVTDAVAGKLTDQAKPVAPDTLVLAWKRSESPTARVWPVGATETDGTSIEGGGPGAVAGEEPSHAGIAAQRTQKSARTESIALNDKRGGRRSLPCPRFAAGSVEMGPFGLRPQGDNRPSASG